MGPLGLHGGGEYLAGDEPFLRSVLQAAATGAGRGTGDRPLRVAVVPTAAANQAPGLAGRTGVAAFERVAEAMGLALAAAVVPVVDAGSAEDPALLDELAAADLVHLPGGDPALVPGILAGTGAWRATVSGWTRGALLAGASAGAMGLCEWTWTPSGVRPGLGLVRGLVVVPHFERIPPDRWERERGRADAAGVGLLGLDERTGVLSGAPGEPWRVAGAGRVHWLAPGERRPVEAGDGDAIELRGVIVGAG